MPQRSEPQILADLIRLAERFPGYYGVDCGKAQSEQADADAELIEQARAALHRYVVAEGKAYLSRPRAPLTLWTGACFAAGSIATGVAMLFGWPLTVCISAAMLIVTGASILIDHKHL
jgi:hypothetical protein